MDTYEAGMQLTGTEVKSLRAGRASLVDAFAQVSNGEIFFLHAMHIPEYTQHVDQPRAAADPEAAAEPRRDHEAGREGP